MYQKQQRMRIKDIIAEALKTLLKRKLYIDITVSELVDIAQISRASFYRYYNSIDDVLAYIVDEIDVKVSSNTPSILSYEKKDWYKAGVELFKYILKVKDSFFEVESKNSSYILHRLERKSEFSSSSIETSVSESYLISALMGMIYGIADKWRRRNYMDSPEAMSMFMTELVYPFLQACKRNMPMV